MSRNARTNAHRSHATQKGARPKPPRRGRDPQVERLLDAALAHHREGRLDEAAQGFRRVLEAAPDDLDALMNLGTTTAALGRPADALPAFRRAMELAPRNAAARVDFGRSLAELGRWEDAARELETAARLDPGSAETLMHLGRALIEAGRHDDAKAALERAVLLKPLLAWAWFELHRAVFDDRSPRPAIDALSRAVASDPDLVWAKFCLAVALDLAGDARAAKQQLGHLHPDEKVFAGAVDSFEYMRAHRTERTRYFVSTRDVLLFALEQASLDGLVLEAGVRFGTSARWIAAASPRTLHGFDSFQGLPESWHILPEGAYSTHGQIPDLPANVVLHVGLFEDTLPAFAREHQGPIRFANVDCDLESSTATFLRALGDRIVPGTVLVFDEYLVNDAWREDEHKAFQEAVRERGWRYEYLAASLFTGQAAIRIL